jgi:hypothetical protein
MQQQPSSERAILLHQPLQPGHQRDIVQASNRRELQIIVSHTHPFE